MEYRNLQRSAEFQGRGVGSALINRALWQIEELGASGCILTGDPNYYARFGFELAPALATADEPAEYFMIKVLGAVEPQGPFRFHDTFYGAA